MAEAKTFTVHSVNSVAVTGMSTSVGGNALYTEASCDTEGIVTSAPAITYTTTGENGEEEALPDSFAPRVDGTLTVTREFTTAKRKIVSVAAPEVPTDNTFTTYYGFEGYADTPVSVSSNELGNQAMVTLKHLLLI